MVFFLCFAKIVKAERNTKKAGFFLLPRRRLSYLKIVQAAFFLAAYLVILSYII